MDAEQRFWVRIAAIGATAFSVLVWRASACQENVDAVIKACVVAGVDPDRCDDLDE